MWESFERRFEAEHYLGPQVRARALIEQLAGLPDDATEEVFRSELAPLSYVDLRAFYNRVVELTGGPSGQAEENADTAHSRSRPGPAARAAGGQRRGSERGRQGQS